jgi:hypothetical protein
MPPRMLPPPLGERGVHPHKLPQRISELQEKEFFNKAINYAIFCAPPS